MSGLYLLFSVVLVIVVIGAASIIFFRVNRVEVEGNEHYTSEEIIAASGVTTGDNLMLTSQAAVAARIRNELPYVSSVSVQKQLPDRVLIRVTESGAQVAIYDGVSGWWLMDVSGKLLERAPAQTGEDGEGSADPAESAGTEPETAGDEAGGEAGDSLSSGVEPELSYLPPATEPPAGYAAVIGLALEEPESGHKIAVPEEAERSRGLMLDSLLKLLPALQNHSLLGNVTSIDLTGESELLVTYQGRLTIKLLQDMDYDYQARLIEKALEYISESWQEEDSGTLDMTFSDGNPRLTKNNSP